MKFFDFVKANEDSIKDAFQKLSDLIKKILDFVKGLASSDEEEAE